MKTKIFQIALIMTVVYDVRCEGEFKVGPGTFVVSSSGATRSGHDVLPKENKTNMIVSVTNTGDLVEGKINTNISNLTEIRSVFASMKKLNVTFQCNILDYVLFEIRFCRKYEKEQEKAEQELEKGMKQDQQEEPPKGKYNSKIQILKQTHFFGGVWTVRLSIFVRYEATLFTKKAYEVCSRKKPVKSLNNLQEVNKTSTEMSDKKTQAEMKKVVDFAAAEGNRAQKKEKEGANNGVAKLRPFVRPIYIKITVRPKRKIEDLKEGERLYYILFDFQNQCVVIKAGRLRSVPEARNKTKIVVTGLNLNIEASSEVEGKHTFLVYNNRFEHLHFLQQKDQMSKKANRVEASYSSDAFKNVTMEKQANATLFVFDISNKQRNQERSVDKILVYISHEKKIEEYLLTPPSLTAEEKTSLSGSFHIKTDASNRITHENQMDIVEEVRKVESCDICPEAITNWLMEAFGTLCLMDRVATKHEQGVKPEKSSKLITCGTVTFELSSTDNPEPNAPVPRNIFLLYLNTKKILNEDGKQIGEEQKSDERQRTTRLSPEDDEKTKHALKKIEMLQPVFERNVQDAVADIKKTITTKFGKDIWDKAEYRSELKISRNVVCAGSCQTFIKAALRYKLIQKAKPKVLQPKEHIKMLLRFHFFAKFIKPQTPFTALMKRPYSPKYRAHRMPMTKQIPPPKHATKNMPQTSTKAVPESLDQKVRFESAKDKRNRFPTEYLTLPQHTEFLEYQMTHNQKEREMEALRKAQENKQVNIPNSGYALRVDKSIIIAFANCLFLFLNL